MEKSAYSVAVIGATGLVGSEIIAALAERQFPLAKLQLYSSLRSAGEEVGRGGLRARVDLLEGARFADTDLVFLAAGEQISAEWVERITDAGAVAIDTSHLFVDDLHVPLVVPEVNTAELADYAARRIVASPDSPAIALAILLNPLHAAVRLARIVATTFEPVSGAGRAGIDELQQQTVELMSGRSATPALFAHRIAFNALPQVGEFVAGGASRDEAQTARALQRLLGDSMLPVSVTRVRVPLFYGMALSVNIETDETVSATAARELLRAAPGIMLQDDTSAGSYPTPAEVVGQDATCVGRIRADEAANLLDAWVTIDNIRKGSAINAVQIAETLIRDYL